MVDATGVIGVSAGVLGLLVVAAAASRRDVRPAAILAAVGLAIVSTASLGLGVLEGAVPAPVLGAQAAAFAATGLLSRSPE